MKPISDMARVTLVHDFLVLELNDERIILRLTPLTQTRMRAAIEKGRGPLDEISERVVQELSEKGVLA